MMSNTWPPAEKDRFMEELAALYAAMDGQYRTAALQYRFECSGCVDNCCLTRFHHHTWLEYLYLRGGFLTLAEAEQAAVADRAAEYDAGQTAADAHGESFQGMCPVNVDGHCILYAHRPMICRLHGIPHELAPPGRPRIYGEGCAEFRKRCGDRPYVAFDRTPFYTDMAALERRLREAIGLTGKIKMTIARMLTEIAAEAQGEGKMI